MKRLEIRDSEMMRIAVQNEIQRSEESRYDHRLHGILLVCSGQSCYEVAQTLGHSPRTIQGWVRAFEKSGFSGLQEEPRPGRPTLLDNRIYRMLGRELRKNPQAFGYQQHLWDGKLLGHHLAKRHGIRLGIRQCQRVFHVLGFRRRKPRPVIASADPMAQAAYKKTAADGSTG